MNRCVVCGKPVIKKNARSSKLHEGHEYLVCCPMCEAEFKEKPDYYINIAQVTWGSYGSRAYNQKSEWDESRRNVPETFPEKQFDHLRMIRNLTENYENLRSNFADVKKHFDTLIESGGLEGLRGGLLNHHKLLSKLANQMSVHEGVCQFIVSIFESEMKSNVTS